MCVGSAPKKNPTDGKQISRDEKTTNGNVLNYEDEEEDQHNQEYKKQSRGMTDEQIERHIGLEKVKNV